MRMWLFGMITIIEMYLSRQVESLFPDQQWQQELSAGRLEKSKQILQERQRRNQDVALIDCLQLADKAQILMKLPEQRDDMDVSSRREAERALKEIESLRNNLAHAQDILTYNWETILNISRRVEKIMTRV